MQDGEVNARIIHFCDEQLRGALHPIEHRRVILFGVILVLVIPAKSVSMDGELHISQIARSRIDQGIVTGWSTVAYPPSRLMVNTQLTLKFIPPVLDGVESRRFVPGWKTVCVTVNDQFALFPDARKQSYVNP